MTDLFPDELIAGDEFERLTCQWSGRVLKLDPEVRKRCDRLRREQRKREEEQARLDAEEAERENR